MSARILATNAFWSLLSHLLSRGSLMLSTVILARSLDTASFAAYSYFQLTVSMLAAYAAMGLGVSASRFFAEVGYDKPNVDSPPVGALWVISILLASVAFVMIILMPNTWIAPGLVVPNWLLAFGVFALVMTVVPNGAILGLERYKHATLISGISGATMLLVVWWASQRDLPTVAMSAIALSALLQALGESVIVIQAVGWKKISVGFRLRRNEVRRVFSLAGPMFFVTLVSASGSWLLGRMILRGEGGEHEFSMYVIGLQWFSLGLLLPGMISRVILPRLVRSKFSETSAVAGKELVIQGAKMATTTALVMALLCFLLGPWLLLIYGANYQVEGWFIAAFLGAAILSAPANVVGNAIVANDGQKIWLALTILWLAILLISGMLASTLGALSGAVAHAVAAAVLTMLAFIIARTRQLV